MFRKVVTNKWFIIAAVCIVAYTLVGFFLVPRAVKYGLENLVAKELGTPIRVQQVRTNPYTFTVRISQFSMQDPNGGELLDFDHLLLDFDNFSLFHWAWTFEDFKLDNPTAHITMLPGYRLNVLDLIPASATQPAESSFAMPRFKFKKFNLNNGRLVFADQSDATPFEIELGPTDIEINDLSSLKDQNGRYTIAAQTDDGASIEWQGSISLNPIASQGKLSVQNLTPVYPFLFVADFFNLDEPSGNVDVQSEYRFAYTGGEIELIVDNTRIDISDLSLALADRQGSLLTLAKTSVQDVKFDLNQRLVRIGTINAVDGRLVADSDAKGVNDFQLLLKAQPQSAQSETKVVSKPDGPPWRVELDSLAVQNIEINNTSLRYVEPAYLQGRVNDVTLQARAEIGANNQVEVENINGRLSNLNVRIGDDTEPWAQLENLEYRNGAFDLQNKTFSLDEVRLKTGNGRIWLDSEKKINWLQAFRLRDEAAVDVALEAVKEVIQDDRILAVTIKNVTVDDFGARFTDNSVKPAADLGLQNLTATFTNVSNHLQKPIEFDIKTDTLYGALLQAAGTVIPGKVAADAQVRADGLDLKVAQPYLAALFPLSIDSGIVNAQGRLNTLSAEKKINITYAGNVNVSRLKINETRTGELLAGFEALDIPAMTLSLAPNSLTIKSVNIKTPRGRVTIDEDSTINVVDIFTQPSTGQKTESKPSQTAKPAPAFPVAVQRIRIEDGQLDFSDSSVKPKFQARIGNVNGAVNGLTTPGTNRAAINLKGLINDYAQFKMNGKLQPMQPTDNLNMDVVVRSLKLRPLTPYSAKFAGRELEAGRLSLDMQYSLKQKRLHGDNKIVASKLVLGPETEQKGQFDLPLDLAVALLKDADDRIKLNLAIDGSLDDPGFNFGQLVGQSLGQVLGNIAAAPFSVIGRMAGTKKAKLDAIGFDPGQIQATPSEKEKLSIIANGLKERPELVLQIQGYYHKDVDGTYLRSLAVRREIARRLEYEVKDNEDPGQFDASDKNVQKVIEAMVAERYSPDVLDQLKTDFEKDSGAVTASTTGDTGADPDRLYRNMFEYLVEQQPLDGSVMVQLARGRSDMVYQELSVNGQLEPARLVVLEPAGTTKLQDGMVPSKLNIAVEQKQ